MAFFVVVIAGWLGIVANWYVRWEQGHTTSTFFEYLNVYRAHTVASFITVFVTSATAYQVTPIDLTFVSILGAFLVGYYADKGVNKDKSADVSDKNVVGTIISEVKNEQKNKSLGDLLDDDRRL